MKILIFFNNIILKMRKKQKLKTFDSSFFIGKDFFGDDDFGNVSLLHHPIFSTLVLKKQQRQGIRY